MSVGLWKERAECRRKRKWMKAVSAVALIGLLSGFPAFSAEAGWVSEEDGWYYYLMDGRLNQKSTDEQAAATCDYAVFKAMMYQISAAPELLEEAIYDAWQGENKWKINRDSWVRVGEGNEIWMQTGSN